MKIIAYQGRRQVVQFLSIPIAAQQAATSAGGVIDLDRDFAGVGFRLSSDNNKDEANNKNDSSTNSLQWLVGVDIDEATDNRQGFENFVRTAVGTTRLGERGNLRRDEINRQRSADTFLQLSLPLHSPYSSDRNNNWRIYSALRQSRLKFSVADNYIRPGNRDDSGAREFSAVSPALGVVNSWGDKNNRSTFHASIGQGFETPTSAEQAYRADQQSGVNVDLRASRNRQIESGYRYFTPRTDIRATAFAIFSRDEIVAAATVAGRSSFQNAAGTSRQGIELAWRGALSVSYTAIRARLTEQYVADVGPAARIIAAGNRLPAVPAQNFYADICWRCRAAGLSMTTELIARSAMFANDTNLAKAAGQMRLNTSLSYRAPVQIAGYVIELGATLRIDNLLAASGPGSVIVNDANARFFEPSPPRRMLLGLSGKLRF
jgi:iron complex outermembrane receptor protein